MHVAAVRSAGFQYRRDRRMLPARPWPACDDAPMLCAPPQPRLHLGQYHFNVHESETNRLNGYRIRAIHLRCKVFAPHG